MEMPKLLALYNPPEAIKGTYCDIGEHLTQDGTNVFLLGQFDNGGDVWGCCACLTKLQEVSGLSG